MRKYLMMGAALSLLAATPMMAYAGDHDHKGTQGGDNGGKYTATTIDAFLAFAAAHNGGSVVGGQAELHRQTSSVSTTDSFNNSKGLSSQAQNSGANSALQNSLALAYVKNPSNANHTIGIGIAVAGAGNGGGVYGNNDQTGSWNSWDHDHDDGTVTQSASMGSSYNNFKGVAQSNQNVGDNSLLQNSTAVAAVSPIVGTAGTLSVALAGSNNNGEVSGNWAYNNSTQSSSTVDGSFDNSRGVFSLNQNSGANSLMQNSAAIGTVTLKPTSASALAASVAVATNHGELECDTANAANGTNSSSMNNSFNNSQGVFQASQNSGANSLIQNSVSVGAVR